jgi:MoaA/NifB/PqqE/SkfB family radical SAM enzyme
MKLRNKLGSIGSLIKIRFFKMKVPLAVRWQLTNNCNHKCLYCDIWADASKPELSTEEIFALIDSLKEAGTQTISFSGGEPLMRTDIGKILEYCRKKNISTSINSNGTLVPQKLDQIQTLDLLKISLDGPSEIHDRLAHCSGSYQEVILAVQAARSRGIKTFFTTTITKDNVNCLSDLLKIAEKFNSPIAFQPLKRLGKGLVNLNSVMPGEKEYKNAIAGLIELKKKGNRYMRNSLYELEYIYHWPRYKSLNCWAGKVFCMIGVGGELYPCDRVEYNSELPNCVKMGFKKAFAALPADICCEKCGFCGTLELNFLLSFKLKIMKTIKEVID